MINKLYGELLDYIKHNWGFLLTLIIITITFFIPTGYSIYKPGGNIDIADRITSEINGEKNTFKLEGSLNLAYVGMLEAKLPFYLISFLFPSWDLVENTKITWDESENIRDSIRRDQIFFNESINHAKIVAYSYSGVDFEVTEQQNKVVFVSERTDADIKIGDEIISYDGNDFTSFDEMRDYIQTVEPGDKIEFTIIRDDKERKTSATVFVQDDRKLVGISAAAMYTIESDVTLSIDSKATESGSSGGLMLTLAMYAVLAREDVTRGKIIVGTGSIDIEGNVDAIGGVVYKLGVAEKMKADIFIVPSVNYAEAREYADSKNFKVNIISVSTFEETLKALRNA